MTAKTLYMQLWIASLDLDFEEKPEVSRETVNGYKLHYELIPNVTQDDNERLTITTPTGTSYTIETNKDRETIAFLAYVMNIPLE